MKTIIVGLGNPENRYLNTRHNVGFIVVDSLSSSLSTSIWSKSSKFECEFIEERDVVFVKPLTYMNSSGKSVRSVLAFFKVEASQLYVIHDDLDIPLGEYKVQFGKGPKLHGGINSIEEELLTDQFWRVRIGVDNRDPNDRELGESYVLKNFTKEEQKLLKEVTKKVDLEIHERINDQF